MNKIWNVVATGALLTIGLSLANPPVAIAQVAEQSYSIAAGDLDSVLRQFASQSRIQLIYSAESVRGKRSTGLRGVHMPAEALQQLLSSSGLQAEVVNDRTIALRPAILATPVSQDAPMNAEPSVDARRDRGGVGSEQVYELEKIMVTATGTSLRDVAAESSPLQIYTREEILESGVTTTEQFIRVLPQNFGGGSSEFAPSGLPNDINSRQNDTFGTSANLRGLGSRGTLVLLNGERLAPSSGIGDFIDISMIPISALERVDVLTDGASSIYGGDAVAGVINFVLRDDFRGGEVSARYGSVTNGSMGEFRSSQTVGTTWPGGSIIGAYEFFSRDALSLADRSALAVPQTIGGIPASSEDLDLLPKQKRHSAMISVKQSIGDRLDLSSTGFYSNRSTDSSSVVASSTIGLIKHDTSSEVISVSARAEYQLSPRWFASTGLGFSEVSNRSATLSSTAAGPVQILADFGSDLASAEMRLNGTLARMPGGMIKTALGVQLRRESFEYQTRGIAAIRDGNRDVAALFSEVQVPLVGADNALPGVKRLEVNLSGRIDDYSDFGTSVNPKIGVLYSPSETFKLRASYSTSFAPPALGRSGALDRAGSVFPYSFILNSLGYPLPDPSLSGVDYLVTSGTQANLDAETSHAVTVGFDRELSVGRHHWSLSGTYYEIDFEGRLGQTPMPQNINQNYAPNIAFADSTAFPAGTVVFLPSPDEVEAIIATFTRPPNLIAGARLDNIGIVNNVGIVRNLSMTRTRGVDIHARYETDLPFATLFAGVNANYILAFKQQATSTTPVVDVVNTLYNPIDLRVRGNVGLRRAGFASSLFLNYTDSYRADDSDVAAAIASWATFDLNIAYEFSPGRKGVLAGSRFGVSVVNLFDKSPPATPWQGNFGIAGYDPANASPLGRFVAIEISKRF